MATNHREMVIEKLVQHYSRYLEKNYVLSFREQHKILTSVLPGDIMFFGFGEQYGDGFRLTEEGWFIHDTVLQKIGY